jgi:hypothetical protein
MAQQRDRSNLGGTVERPSARSIVSRTNNTRSIVLHFFTLLLLVALPTFSAHAQDGDGDNAEAAKLIHSCKAKAQPHWDSGITSEMQNATYDYIECLKGAINGESAKVFGAKTRKTFMKEVDHLETSSMSLYSTLYTANKSCDCGTMSLMLGPEQASEALERVLTNVVEEKDSIKSAP